MARLRALAVNLALSAGVSGVFLGALEIWAHLVEAPHAAPAVREHFPDWGRWEGDFYRFGAAPPSWPPAPTTNADGLRDRHHSVRPTPGRRRLACLGDSVTYGYGLRAENAYPQRLEALLEGRGGRLEVFNAAAPGWTTRQQRIAYEQVLRKYRPERVLLGVCLNDIPELQNNLARTPRWLSRLHARSALVRRLVGATEREIRSVHDLFERPEAPGVSQGYERFFAEVRHLRASVRADGGELLMMVFPFRFQVEPGAPPPRAQALLAAFAAREGLAFVDLLPTLAPLGTAGFSDYCHLAPAGVQAVAEYLAEHPVLGAPVTWTTRLRAAGLPADASQAPETALVELAGAGDPELRAAAVWALGLAPAAATPPGPGRLAALERALADADAVVRYEGARSSARLRVASAAARARLLARLDDLDEAQRLAAAEALWACGARPADAAELGRRLGHADPYIAAFAEEALLRLGGAALEALRAALGEPADAARRRAARVLARLGPQAAPAVAELARLVDDARAEPGLRRAAARALGEVGPPARAALPALARAATDDDGGLRRAARAASRRIAGS